MEESAPLKVKLAFQGGGAKLVSLLESAIAIGDLQKKGKIKIVEVAGTSAGSIVAALVAVEADLEKVKAKLILDADKILKSVDFSSKLGVPALLVKAYLGKPLLDDSVIIDVVSDLIKEGTNKEDIRFNNVKIPLSICATDLASGTKKVYNATNTSDAKLVNSICNSCAIPLVFRSWSNTKDYVDGGICENLPIEEFEIEEGIQNISIGFRTDEPSDRAKFEGLFSFLGKLVAVSIDHNVVRSEMSNHCHYSIKLPNSIDTLKFDDALAKLTSEDHSERIKMLISHSFKDIRLQVERKDKDSQKNLEIENNLRIHKENAFEALLSLEHDNVEIIERVLAITPYCLFDPWNGDNTRYDRVCQFHSIVPKETLYGYLLNLGSSEDSKREPKVIVTKENEPGKRLQTMPIEISKDELSGRGNRYSRLFLFFKSPLEAGVRYNIHVEYSIDQAFIGLQKEGKDYLVINNQARAHEFGEKITIENVALVFFCPEKLYDKVFMSHYEDDPSRNSKYKVVEGSQLTNSAELESYKARFSREVDTVPMVWQYNKGLKYRESIGVFVRQK